VINSLNGFARFVMNEDVMTFFFIKDRKELAVGSGLHEANWSTMRLCPIESVMCNKSTGQYD
jgi:hypothetical protein